MEGNAMTHNKNFVEFEVVAHQYTREKQYWLTRLSGELPKSVPAFDYKKMEAAGSVDRASVSFSLPAGISSTLLKISNGVDEVLHMALTAVVVLLLDKYIESGDILVGTTIYKQTVQREFINTLLPLRVRPDEEKSFKDLMIQVREAVMEAVRHQNYPMDVLAEQLKLPVVPGRFTLFDTAVLLGNIHDKNYLNGLSFPLVFFFTRNDGDIEGIVEYDPSIYEKVSIRRIITHFIALAGEGLIRISVPISEIDILSEGERKQILEDFNNTTIDYPREKTIPQLFCEQVEKFPYSVALRYENETVTYKDLDERSDRLANYLYFEAGVRPGEPVGVFMDRGICQVVSILATVKAGSIYMPIDPSFPEIRIKTVIDDAAVRVCISLKRHIKSLNRLLWECPSFQTFICPDSENIRVEEEVEKSELMGVKLWEFVGETADDEVTGGGWTSSYTGEPIPAEEMAEYGDNILKKLTPYFHKEMRVLEIGCASGISMYRIAPHVGLYYGTDLSSVIIRKNRERIEAEGHGNIRLACLPAHRVDDIEENDFDLIIINSVIQCFHGHNYLENVLRKAVDKLADKGLLFIGDIMNADLKEALIADLMNFKKAHRDNPRYKTKTDWSEELFISPSYLEDLMWDIPEIRGVDFSEKIYTMENELTKFRYDALLTIDKNEPVEPREKSGRRHKYRHDLQKLRKYGNSPLHTVSRSEAPVYIIYTSGSTGIPRGVMVTHRNVLRLVINPDYVLLTEETRILQTGAPVFDATTFEIWGSLLNGGQLVFVDKEVLLDASRLGMALKEYRVNTLWLSSSLFNRLVQQDIGIFSSLKYLLVGGDVLSPAYINSVREKFSDLRIINGYGPTENTTFSTTYPIERFFSDNIPIGRPIGNSTAYIVNKHGQLKPVGVWGELWVGGDGVSLGYLNSPELTAEKFNRTDSIYKAHAFYKTGDQARWLADGTIEFSGRMDRQVKIRGFRIELGEIESLLRRHTVVKEAVVTVRGSDENKYLCAYFVSHSRSRESIATDELREHLAALLPDYMVPAHFVELKSMPLTPNGKIDREALPEPEAARPDDYSGPESPIQEKLVEIWAEVLNIDKNLIGIDANFFNIGGHSLKATVLMSKIHKEMNVKIQLAEIFASPTIRNLSQHIETAEKEYFISIYPAEKKQYYVLSPAQKRLYILQQMGAVYNMTAAWTLNGALDRDRLEAAVHRLLRRHESLRTSIRIVAGEPVQEIHQNTVFDVEYLEKSEGGVERLIRPFDLSRAPLMRVGVIREEEGKNILVLDMHHIVTDGTSLGLFIQELMVLYDRKDLPALRLQYKDYSEWHKKVYERNAMVKQEEYWLKEFRNEVPVLNLPYDFPRPAVQSYEGRTLQFNIEREEIERLKGLTASEEATLYMLLLAVFNVLIAKLSGNEDIVLGTPIAGRRHADLEPIIGMFVGTLALRNYPTPERTFRDFFREVKERTLAAFENQDFQFEDLVEKVLVTRDLGRNPLFDVMFALQNVDRQSLSITGLEVEMVTFENRVANFDLFLQGFEKGDGVTFLLTYCTRLFKDDTVERFTSYFRRLTVFLIEKTDVKLSAVEIISEPEKRQILEEFNRARDDFPADKTLYQIFEEQVQRTPDVVALNRSDRNSGTCMTYKELYRETGRLARILLEKGVMPGDIAAVKMKRCFEMVIGILGILKAGAAYLPVDPDYPRERVRYILTDSSAKIVLDEPGELKEEPVAAATSHAFPAVVSSDIAYVIYTSGSTGKPKGTLVSHRSAVNILCHLEELYPVGERGVYMLKTNYTFDVSVTEFFGWFFGGGQLALLPPGGEKAPETIVEAITRSNVTHINFVPSMLNLFLDTLDAEAARYLCRVRYIFAAGEAFEESLVRKIAVLQPGVRFENIYGPTEAAVYAARYSLKPGLRGKVPIGKPLKNVTIAIVDRAGILQPMGIPGELIIGGEGVAVGYLNNPELTAEKFNWFNLYNRSYRTGDLARWLPDGNIEYLGRIDRQVKIRGYRIESGEIENCLSLHDKVGEAAVIPVTDPLHYEDKYLCAYIVPSEKESSESSPLSTELREYLSKSLPAYMIPTHFILMEAFPLTPSGKLDRGALPVPDHSRPQLAVSFRKPQTRLEVTLADIWKDILALDNVGIDDNFFELGGNSLKLIQANTKLKEIMQRDIPLVNMFRYSTIAALADFLSEGEHRNIPVYVNRTETIEKGKIKLKNLKQKQKMVQS
jgi:amino acid adenylation domain-containing protein